MAQEKTTKKSTGVQIVEALREVIKTQQRNYKDLCLEQALSATCAMEQKGQNKA